jgi:hypothetical protein
MVRRPGWLLAVVALGFVSVAACGGTEAEPASSGAVPWIAFPATNVYPPAPSPKIVPPVSIPTGTPPCKAAQLEGALLGMSAATGHTNTPVSLRNAGSAACWMAGYVDLTILDGAGHELVGVTGASLSETFFGDGPAIQVLMQPGTPPLHASQAYGGQASRGQAFMNIEWYDCRQTHAASLSLYLPGNGGKLMMPFDVQAPGSPVCDSSGMSPVGLRRGPLSPAGYTWPPQPVYLKVDIAIAAPASAKRGTTLVYFVTVTNADQVDYRLDPCLNYVESLAKKEPVASYQLNCSPVRHIPVGGSVKFEMRLDLPGDLAAGPNQLMWVVYDQRLAMPSAQTPIEIT